MNQRGKKLPNKANFEQPTGNQWVTAGFRYGGSARLGKTRRIAPPEHAEGDHLALDNSDVLVVGVVGKWETRRVFLPTRLAVRDDD